MLMEVQTDSNIVDEPAADEPAADEPTRHGVIRAASDQNDEFDDFNEEDFDDEFDDDFEEEEEEDFDYGNPGLDEDADGDQNGDAGSGKKQG